MFYYRRFIFFSPRDFRAGSADRRETLPRDHNLGALYNPSPQIRGLSPENLGPNMQNLVRFYTTSDFNREYLWNESRTRKA